MFILKQKMYLGTGHLEKLTVYLWKFIIQQIFIVRLIEVLGTPQWTGRSLYREGVRVTGFVRSMYSSLNGERYEWKKTREGRGSPATVLSICFHLLAFKRFALSFLCVCAGYGGHAHSLKVRERELILSLQLYRSSREGTRPGRQS